MTAVAALAVGVQVFRPVSAREVPGVYRCVRTPGGRETLTLRPNGEYRLESTVGGWYGVETGTWGYDGDSVFIRPPAGAGFSYWVERQVSGKVRLMMFPDSPEYFYRVAAAD